MKYSFHMAVVLLLAMSSWTHGEDQMVVRIPNTPAKHVFEVYSSIATNTALVLPAQIAVLQSSKTITLMPDKPMERSVIIGLIEEALDKQAGIKIRHVSLEETLALNTIEMGGKETVLAVSLPPFSKQSSTGTSNEVRSISFANAPLEEFRKFYEAVSGTKVIYEGIIVRPREVVDFTLHVGSPMTKDAALKLLDMTLAMQAGIKVRQEQPGQTVWSRDLSCPVPKAK